MSLRSMLSRIESVNSLPFERSSSFAFSLILISVLGNASDNEPSQDTHTERNLSKRSWDFLKDYKVIKRFFRDLQSVKTKTY